VSAETPYISGDSFTLFVYGTLMRGGPRHRVLAGQRFLGEARTRSLYALYDLGDYPGLVRREPDGRAVWGELYEVAAGLVARLDRIEGAPNLFRLEPVLIEGHDGPVLAYFCRQETQGVSPCPGDRWQNR
jgi:gamma-glutamylaminecyclotransferase